MRSAFVRCTVPFALAVAAACASGGGGRRGYGGPRVYVDTNVVQVQVRSNYIGPVDLYVASEGVATRLGEANGPTVQTFVIDPDRFDIRDLRIVAVPVGGYGRASTGLLNLRRGNVVQFNIETNLRQSTTFVR